MRVCSVLAMTMLFFTLVIGQSKNERFFPLDSRENLQLLNVEVQETELDGKTGIQVSRAEHTDYDNHYETLVVIEDVVFTNGTIELEIAGVPADDAPRNSRGFVGVAFRIDPANKSNYECIYLRPLNGRAENQIQRNHSVQYVAHPDYPWHRLRKEQPGVYESYVDLIPKTWTKVKIVVSGDSAQLFVHGAAQPTLIVNDLKLEERAGQVGLWLHTSTVAFFRNLKITNAD